MIPFKPQTTVALTSSWKIAAAIMLLSLCGGADARSQRSSRASQGREKTQQRHNRASPGPQSIVAAEPDVARLPPGYSGHSAVNIFTSLYKHSKLLTKNQFETTETYRNRIPSLIKTSVMDGGRTSSERLTFVLPAAEISYNADTRLISFKLETNPSPYVEVFTPESKFDHQLSDFVVTELNSETRTLGSTVGQNVLGVRRRIQIRRYSKLYLALLKRYVDRWSDGVRLPLEPDNARRLIAGLKLAVTGQIVTPYIGYDTSSDEATITDPEEAHFNDFYLFFYPDALVIYHQPSGQVLGSLDLIKLSQSNPRPGKAVLLGQEEEQHLQ